ncbi:MAG: linoleoyl-CoA desaturase [Mucilaginibacter sp.]|nr:linoleoyl-CoA desaturase [Mucilaginibacter sp.]
MDTYNFIKPVFKKAGTDDFYHDLYHEVKSGVLGNKKYRQQMLIKSMFFLVLFFFFYSCILILGNTVSMLFLSYILTGITMILVFLNAFHDAAHGAIFKKRRHNEYLTNILELFGCNSFVWKKRHLILHHPYPNIQHWDIDIKQSDIVRIFPGSKWFSFHRYQHIYMWFLYFCYTLNWLFIRDFKDFFGVKNNYVKRIATIPKIEYVKLFCAKVLNLVFLLGVPMLVLQQYWYVVFIAFITMHFTASAFGVMALLSTHADENAEFPMPPPDGQMNTTWAMYQVAATKDFSTESRLANILFGGFNHHVAHHLFPTVAHTHYPAITPIIRKYALKYNLPYRSYSLFAALRSHFMLLKRNGSAENLFATGDL